MSSEWNYESFRQGLKEDFKSGLHKYQKELDPNRTLRIDLHCHDKNSDVPDELWGRLLGLPETWIKPKQLVNVLKRNNVDALTITNHNNAKSCWALVEKGYDVLSAAEFTCYMEDENVSLHVLTYGFSPKQEEVLNKLRKDVYVFLAFCKRENIPTILPHPTYLYYNEGEPNLRIFEKLALLFERFEVLNGQRDVWQNLLTMKWLESLSPNDIDNLAIKHQINPNDFCHDPYTKRFAGGSDDHMGIFAGSCGTILEVPSDIHRNSKPSFKVLEALRRGKMAPYGFLGEEHEKLNIAFLDYFSQVIINMKDPGLMRLIFHKGTVKDKLICWAIGNSVFELRQHKHTLYFLKLLHKSLRGKRVNSLKKWLVNKNYRMLFERVIEVSRSVDKSPVEQCRSMKNLIEGCVDFFSKLMFTRLHQNENTLMFKGSKGKSENWENVFECLELPLNLRSLLTGERVDSSKPMADVNATKILDQLSFPLLGAGLIGFSIFASAKVMFKSRSVLDGLSNQIGLYGNPNRILWLADSVVDRNGVAVFTKELLHRIRKENLPIDILVCGEVESSVDHLHVLPAVGTLKHEILGKQIVRIPDVTKIINIAYRGAYSRVVATSESMALVALALKMAYQIPASFYLHHDWLEYFKVTHHFESTNLNRVRRMLRGLYQQFDQVFVLNGEQRNWLLGESMGINLNRIHMTNYWVPEVFQLKRKNKFNLAQPSLIYVGRLSREKGVMELVELSSALKASKKDFKLKILGEGPCLNDLKKQLPDAEFLPYCDRMQLPMAYSNSDFLIFPSKFDAFGTVMLEAMSCGLPVIAYKNKAAMELIEDGRQGFLVDSVESMRDTILRCCEEGRLLETMSEAAHLKALTFNGEVTLAKLCRDLELDQGVEQAATMAI